MRFLVDTQVFMWAAVTPQRLSALATDTLSRTDNLALLSAASCWELAIKAALGKLVEVQDLDEFVQEQTKHLSVELLPVESAHGLRTRHLPFHHRDPFDRLLVAQAQVEQIPILTSDVAISRYDVETIW